VFFAISLSMAAFVYLDLIATSFFAGGAAFLFAGLFFAFAFLAAMG
jgi:hypothetical protein